MIEHSRFTDGAGSIMLAPCVTCLRRAASGSDPSFPTCEHYQSGIPARILRCELLCKHYIHKAAG